MCIQCFAAPLWCCFLMGMSLLRLHIIYAVSLFKSLFSFVLPCACWQVICCQVKMKFVFVLCFLLFSCSQTSQNPACHIVRALWVRFLMYKHCACSLPCMKKLTSRDRKCRWSMLIGYYNSSLNFCWWALPCLHGMSHWCFEPGQKELWNCFEPIECL